jgi:archaellin
MSASTLFIKTFCISLVLVSLVMILGCTTTPSGSNGTIPVTSLPSTIVSPVPASTSNPEQSVANIQLKGNIYGLSSNPQLGIDTITFPIGLTPQTRTVDLTRLEIVFSTPGTAPVILTQGTRDSTSTFTTTVGNYAVTSLRPGDEVEIAFRVKGVPAGTNVNIEVRPPVGTGLPLSRTVPRMISSMNILD